jgi:hypothetical protein
VIGIKELKSKKTKHIARRKTYKHYKQQTSKTQQWLGISVHARPTITTPIQKNLKQKI